METNAEFRKTIRSIVVGSWLMGIGGVFVGITITVQTQSPDGLFILMTVVLGAAVGGTLSYIAVTVRFLAKQVLRQENPAAANRGVAERSQAT